MTQRFMVLGSLLLAGAVTTAVQAQVANPATVNGRQVAQVAEQILLGRIRSQAEVIVRLQSPELGASLWQVMSAARTAGVGNVQSTEWARIASIADQKNLSGQAMVAHLRTLQSSRTAITAENFDKLFAQTGPSTQTFVAAEATQQDPEQVFAGYSPKSADTTAAYEAVKNDGSRLGAVRRRLVGSLLSLAMFVTPSLCSASARAECAAKAPEVVLRWVKEGNDQRGEPSKVFLVKSLNGFQGEQENFVGKNEEIVRGWDGALDLGPTGRSKELNSCILTGEADKI